MVVRLSNLYGGNLWAKVRRRLYNEIVPGDKDGWRKQKNKKQTRATLNAVKPSATLDQ